MISILFSSLTWAELPMPAFPECGETDQPELCPDDLGERWTMLSYITIGSGSVREAELEMGSGTAPTRRGGMVPADSMSK